MQANQGKIRSAFKAFGPALLLIVGAFTFYALISLNTNIHGDAKFHSLYAKTSVETGYLVRDQPNFIYSFDGDRRVYTPIAYPLTSEAVLSVFYLIGGETALKLYAPFMAAIIALLLYLCLRDIGSVRAALLAGVVVVLAGERLIMTPLIEPLIVVYVLSALVALKSYFQQRTWAYLVVAGLFLGAAAATKQQGLAAALFTLVFLATYWANGAIRERKFGVLAKPFFLILPVVIIVSAPALGDQFNRNGTLAFAPGKTTIPGPKAVTKYVQPLFESKFPANEAANAARIERIGYNKEKQTFQQKVESIVLAPFLFYRAGKQDWKNDSSSWLFLGLLILLLLAAIKRKSAFSKNRVFWALIGLLILEETIVSHIIHTPVHQYHMLGTVLISLCIFLCAFIMSDKPRWLRNVTVSALLLMSGIGYLQFMQPLWANTGRESDYYISSYERVGEYVKKNTAKDAIFLAAETNFRYYAQRDIVWMNESIGDVVGVVLKSTDKQVTLEKLNQLNIDFVVIDKGQHDRSGVYDYLPLEGIASIVGDPKFFTKTFDATGDGNIVIYRVNYAALQG